MIDKKNEDEIEEKKKQLKTRIRDSFSYACFMGALSASVSAAALALDISFMTRSPTDYKAEALTEMIEKQIDAQTPGLVDEALAHKGGGIQTLSLKVDHDKAALTVAGEARELETQDEVCRCVGLIAGLAGFGLTGFVIRKEASRRAELRAELKTLG
jgi:hypothetical protein